MDGPRDCHTEYIKDKYHTISLICGILKNGTNEHIYKTEIESQLQKTTYDYQVGKMNWETGIDIYTLLYIRKITNKDLLYSTGNTNQYTVMGYMGKESKKEQIYVYI